MTRFCCADHRLDSGRFVRRLLHAAPLLSLVLALLVAGEMNAAATLRVAVAPFSGDVDAPIIARLLASGLAERDLERLIAPGEFVADSSFEPRAADIRRWAYNSAVDAIVVGRVYSVTGAGGRSRVIETVVRSGHSGAELSRHEVSLPSGADMEPSLEALATSILFGLGYRAAPSDANVRDEGNLERDGQGVAGVQAGSQVAAANTSASGLELGLSESGFNNEAPIEIKAEEAEIINRESGRRLIFQRNVIVRQSNVSLRSDRLEAFYEKGESEPRELRAEGRVSIDQGERRAKCDRATYQRETQVLICRGHAELFRGCDIVRGESIEFDLGRDQARVEGAASIVIQPENDVPNDCELKRGSL